MLLVEHILLKLQLLQLLLNAVFINLLLLPALLSRRSGEHLLLDLLQRVDTFVQIRAEVKTGRLVGVIRALGRKLINCPTRTIAARKDREW